MVEQSEGKETYEFTDNLNDRTTLLEEMVKQDELLSTRSNSNLKQYSLNNWIYNKKLLLSVRF